MWHLDPVDVKTATRSRRPRLSTISPQSNPSGTFSFRSAQASNTNPEMPAKARTLVAATVEPRANPSAHPSTQSGPSASGALAFYRHPADRNQAATAILAGRTLDVSA